MAFVNYAQREIILKIVYYGPGLSGKTANIQRIYSGTTPEARGELVGLETREERALFFDFLPMSLSQIRGFETRLHLYSVPGQLLFSATRERMLKGADGVVFVADSRPDRREANLVMMEDLEENLESRGFDVREFPIVLQYNKRDIEPKMSVETMRGDLNPQNRFPDFEACAIDEEDPGVFEALKTLVDRVYERLRERRDASN